MEEKKEFTIDFTNRNIMFDFILGKTTLGATVIAYYDFNKNDIDFSVLNYTLDEYEGMKGLYEWDPDKRDAASARQIKLLDDYNDLLKDFFEDARDDLMDSAIYFVGHSSGLKEGIKAYNPNSSDAQINAVIKNMLEKTFRPMLPPTITDEDFNKLCDMLWVYDRVETISRLLGLFY